MFGFSKNKKPQEKQQDDPQVLEQSSKPKQNWFKRLHKGLTRTRSNLVDKLSTLVLGKKVIDEALLEELETLLLGADLGVDVTQTVLGQLTNALKRNELKDPEALTSALKQSLLAILEPCNVPLSITAQPFTILMIGINGAGKTTSIAKLAHYFQQQDKKVMLAAGDTFRAAAIEQLQVWGERNNVPVIAQQNGSDSASVVFDALTAAKARQLDILIADTAGRLHTQTHLMEELSKIKRVMKKLNPKAPHETLLILDAGIGQNAISQAQQFNDAIGVDGLILTKLDGTAKGGVVFAIAKKLQLPIRFIGVGEGLEDLKPFNAKEFVDALFTA